MSGLRSVLAEFDEIAEFYPGSKNAIVRHPNRGKEKEPVDPDRWDAKPKILKVAGVDTEFFTIGQLGMALGGRKPVTMRKWERLGLIPKATYRKPNEDPRAQRRLYTRAQVEGLVRIATEEGVLATYARPITHSNFTARAVALFRELAAQ